MKEENPNSEAAKKAAMDNASEVADAFLRLSGHPDFKHVLTVLEDFGNRIMKEAITESDPEGVKWYQAEYAILKVILNKLESKSKSVPQLEQPTE